MDEKEVENLRKVYNKEHANEPPIPSGSMKATWSTIKKRLHTKCRENTNACVINSLIQNPDAPESWKKNQKEWLSSIDIDKKEKQFAKVFSEYYFIGSIPIDFDKKTRTGSCLINSICSENVVDIYKRGFKKVGIVFNTDVSTGPGQHWIALFANIDPDLEFPLITYFDSYSEGPEDEIKVLMYRWKEQMDSSGLYDKPTRLNYNATRHQYEDSECGMYCLYFHYCCLVGVSMEKRIPDCLVRAFRGKFFNIKN